MLPTRGHDYHLTICTCATENEPSNNMEVCLPNPKTPIMNSTYTVNQKAVVQEVGKRVDTPHWNLEIPPIFWQLLDELPSSEFEQQPELYMRYVHPEQRFQLLNLDPTTLSDTAYLRAGRVYLNLYRLQCKVDNLKRPESLDGEEQAQLARALRDSLTVSGVSASSVVQRPALGGLGRMPTPFADRTFQLEIASPRFASITEEPGLDSVPWDLGSLGPSRAPPSSPVRTVGAKDLLDSVQCPIIDIDNKKARRASYHSRKPTVLPKERRNELRAAAREVRERIKNPLFEYEAQAFLDFGLEVSPSPAVRGLLERVVTSVERLTSDASSFSPAAAAREVSNNMVGGAFEALSRWLWIVPLVAASYYAVSKADNSVWAGLYGGLSVLLTSVLPSDLWNALQPFWTLLQRREYQAQSGFSVSSLSHITTLVMTYFVTGKADFFSLARDFSKSMTTYSRSVSGWKDLIQFLVGLLESFVNFVRQSFGFQRLNLLKTGLHHVDDWCRRVMDHVNSSQTGGDIMTPEGVEVLVALRNEGRDLTNMYRFTHDVAPILHKYLGYLDHICNVCSAAMHSAKGGRPPPVVVAITGKPGVGKTFLAQMIMSYILVDVVGKDRAEKLDYNFNSLIFQKGSTEYWNGYCGQPGIVVDDWGQSIAVPGTDNDFIDLIRMNSCWSYPLNFADLDNKGKNFFCSEVILLTTNITDIKGCCDVIIEPDAITRRIDFGYSITVNEAFSLDGKLDVSKVEAYQRECGAFPYHAWTLHKHHFAVGCKAITSPAPAYDLKQVLDDVRAKIRSNKGFYASTTQFLRDTIRNEYEAQGGFFDYLKNASENCTIKFGELINFTHGVLGFVKSSLASIDVVFENPLFQMFSTAIVSTLVIHLISASVLKIISWFNTEKKNNDLKNALSKKRGVCDSLVADTINAFRPEDYEVSVVDGLGYKVEKKFTRETLVRALQRMDGPVQQSNTPDNPRFVHRKVTGRRVVESDYVSQGDVYGDTITNVAYANVYRFSVKDTVNNNIMGHCVFVRDTCALLPFHFIDELNKVLSECDVDHDMQVVLDHATSRGLSYAWPLATFLAFDRRSDEQNDAVVIKFPRSVRAHRDIFDKFVKDSDVCSLRKTRVRLDTVEGNTDFIHRSRHLSAIRKDVVGVTSHAKAYLLAKSFEYLGYTKLGDCGGLVTLEESPDKQARRILGIHVAGQPSLGVGLSNIVTQELLLELFHGLGPTEDKLWESQSNLEVLSLDLGPSFLSLNKAKHSHSLNPSTSLCKTPLFGLWGLQNKYPSRLKPFVMPGKGWVYPMRNALLPYATPVITYDKEEVDRAAYQAFRPLFEQTVECDRRIYSFEEACAGVEGGSINGIPRNTSPGYPYALDGHTNKKKFFGTSDAYDFSSAECLELRRTVDDIIEDARNNVRSTHIWIDFLKDELRSEVKVRDGLTRCISSAPLAYVIAFRRFFLSFTDAVQNTRIRNGVAVGINPYTEWDYLSKHLSSKGPHCVAGDFKAFDGSEQPDVHWAILDQINAWYDDGPSNALVRTVLWMEVVHSRHLGQVDGHGAVIYQWNKSLPSGHPATSVINSYYNLILFNMVWTRVFGVQSASAFKDEVAIAVYGDDNVLNIHPDRIAKFNQHTISDEMAKLGMVYTSENKLDEADPVRDLTAVTFLKRGFRYDDYLRRWVGPQELDSILYVPYWCKNKSMMKDIVPCNVEFTYTELALHPSCVWDQYASVIKDKVREVLQIHPLNSFTRREYLLQSQHRDFVWPI